MSNTEERVQRAEAELISQFGTRLLAGVNTALLARAILEAADAPETQKVVVTEEMLKVGRGQLNLRTELDTERAKAYLPCNEYDAAMRDAYTAMRPLEPEPVVTQEVADAMQGAFLSYAGSMVLVHVAQAVLSAAHRVLRGK